MTKDNYENLKNRYNDKNFNRDFKNIYNFSKWFSAIGHIASMALAYFMVTTYVSTYVSSLVLLVGINILIVVMLELLKRVLFSAFSKNVLHFGSIKHSEVWGLMILSILSFSLSFYATIHGAQHFASREDEIISDADDNIISKEKEIEDRYSTRIASYEEEMNKYKELLLAKDNEQTQLESASYLNSRQRNRITDLKKERDVIREDILKVEANIQKVKDEMNVELDKFNERQSNLVDRELNKNSKNTFFFIAVSCIVELLIIGGLFFMFYYEFRSFNEEKKRREENPNYKKYIHFTNILECIYTKDSKENTKIPSIQSIVEMCEISNITVLHKDITNALKLYTTLGILRNSGNTKYYSKTYEEGDKLLMEHFKIIE